MKILIIFEELINYEEKQKGQKIHTKLLKMSCSTLFNLLDFRVLNFLFPRFLCLVVVFF